MIIATLRQNLMPFFLIHVKNQKVVFNPDEEKQYSFQNYSSIIHNHKSEKIGTVCQHDSKLSVACIT